MKKYLIIEDERLNAERLKRLLTDIDAMVEIEGPLTRVSNVVETLARHNDYDLIFADICLKDGKVFEAFKEVMPNSLVIFTTAFDEYALEAFKNNGIDYLMKPIDVDELAAAIRKSDMVASTNLPQQQQSLQTVMGEMKVFRKRLLLSKGDELCVVNVDRINYIYKDGTRARACTDDNNIYTIPLSMTDLEKELDPRKFFRINRQYIANIDGITKINMFFGAKLTVRLKGCSDDNIVISKEKAVLFKQWLNS